MIDQESPSFKSKIHQILVVMASRHLLITASAFSISSIAFAIFIATYLAQMGAVLDLNEMQKQSLLVGGVYFEDSGISTRHSHCGRTIYFTDDKGGLVQYRSGLSKDELDFLHTHKGDRVIVWGQRKLDDCGNDVWPAQIQYGERLIRDYRVIQSKELASKRQAFGVIEAALFFFLLPLICIFSLGYFELKMN